MTSWLNEALAFIAALFVGREAAVAFAASRDIPAAETFGLAVLWYAFLSVVAYSLIRGFDHNRWVHRKLKAAERTRFVRWLDNRSLPQYLVLCVVCSPLPNSFWPTLFLAYVAHSHRRIKWLVTPIVGALGYLSYHAAYELLSYVSQIIPLPWIAEIAAAAVAAMVMLRCWTPSLQISLSAPLWSLAVSPILATTPRCRRQSSDHDLFVSHATLIRGPPRPERALSMVYRGGCARTGLFRAIIDL